MGIQRWWGGLAKGSASRSPTITTDAGGRVIALTDTAISGAGIDTTALHTGDAALIAWSTYTPTLSQGVSTNISKTVTLARYVQIGKTVVVNVRLAVTGTGTAGSSIVVTLPVAVQTGVTLFGVGAFFLRDSSAGADYRGIGVVNNNTTTSFRRGDTTVQSDIGVDPNIAIDSGDIISFGVTYEAA